MLNLGKYHMLLEANVLAEELPHELRFTHNCIGQIDQWVGLRLRVVIVSLERSSNVIWVVLNLLAEPHGVEQCDVDTLSDWSKRMCRISNEHNVVAIVEPVAMDRFVDVSRLLVHEGFDTLVSHHFVDLG